MTVIYSREPKIKYNEFYMNGNKKKEVYYDGTMYEYNEDGKEIYHKNSDGFEEWREYDERGNEIYYRDSINFIKWVDYDYDERGNIVHCKNYNNTSSVKYEFWKEYDEEDRSIHHKDTNNKNYTLEYDEDGYLLYHKYSNGSIEKYNKKGIMIYKTDKYDEGETVWEYDEEGNMVHYRDNTGSSEVWYENGICVYKKLFNKVKFDNRTNKGE